MIEATPSHLNLACLLERTAARRGSAPAVVATDGTVLWTFEGLADQAARLAGGLRELGVTPGHRVLVLERDPRQLYLVICGVIWAGGTVAVPPISVGVGRALAIAAQAEPRAVVASPSLWWAVVGYGGLRRAPVRIGGGSGRLPGTPSVRDLARGRPVAPVDVPGNSVAILSHTTGTTGPSKAVSRTHAVLHAQHAALRALRQLDDGVDRDFVGLPMLILDDLASGVTSVPAPPGAGSSDYGRRVLAAIVRGKATSAAGFPHLFESAVRVAQRGDLGALRTIYIGGSRVRAELIRALAVAAPAAVVKVVYGSTEAEPIAAIDAADYLELLAGSEPGAGIPLGTILPGLEARVAAPVEARPEPAQSGRGTIQIRGPRVSAGGEPGDWVDTGDLGRFDSDGRLWWLGRATNGIGHLAPAEVEIVLEGLDWVARAALVRLASPREGRALVAVQPRVWSRRRVRVDQRAAIAALARERAWPLDRIILVRRLPTLRGAGAKVDDERLRRFGSRR